MKSLYYAFTAAALLTFQVSAQKPAKNSQNSSFQTQSAKDLLKTQGGLSSAAKELGSANKKQKQTGIFEEALNAKQAAALEKKQKAEKMKQQKESQMLELKKNKQSNTEQVLAFQKQQQLKLQQQLNKVKKSAPNQ